MQKPIKRTAKIETISAAKKRLNATATPVKTGAPVTSTGFEKAKAKTAPAPVTAKRSTTKAAQAPATATPVKPAPVQHVSTYAGASDCITTSRRSGSATLFNHAGRVCNSYPARIDTLLRDRISEYGTKPFDASPFDKSGCERLAYLGLLAFCGSASDNQMRVTTAGENFARNVKPLAADTAMPASSVAGYTKAKA